MKIGFVGLGHMGANMAVRLCEAGQDVTVYNRTQARMHPLLEKGAKAAASVAQACAGDVVFTMLADDAALTEVALGPDGICSSLGANAIHVSCSTVGVALSARLAEAHRAKRQGYLAAPVFGRPDAAAAGKLFLVAGGEQAQLDKVQPLLDIIGQRTYRLSPKPEAANLVKLSGNFLLAAMIESLGEAMALVEKGGVNRHAYLEMLTSSIFNLPVYKNYGGMIADRNFQPAGFAAPLGQKDVRLLQTAAEELQVPLPFAGILRDRFLELRAHGGDGLDWSAIGALAAKGAGLEP
jgi:3-hydroxyisobutyrate dehydrogenase-like beta-hydroxyacid dehydrogenase